jgi:hypothetical protein
VRVSLRYESPAKGMQGFRGASNEDSVIVKSTRVPSLMLALFAATAFAGPAQGAALTINGGTAISGAPPGNSVLGQAGIGFGGGQIWMDATLRNSGEIQLTLYDVGSESSWKDQIRLNDLSTGTSVSDKDDHDAGTSGQFVNGAAPFQWVATFTQKSGVTNIRFLRLNTSPSVKLVINGQSPTAVPGSGNASIAFAYLDEAYRIVGSQTNRVLVLLEDSSDADSDYDDYVGILEGPPIVPPPQPDPPVLSISGGTQVTEIPQGNSGNSVLAQAGIGLAGGRIWIDGTLDILGTGVPLALYDVGSESHWINEIRLANTLGNELRDLDDNFRGDAGTFVNGSAPFQVAGGVTQGSGLAGFEFRRIDPTPEYRIVVNGQSPMMMVPGYGYASIALAYLSDSNQVVSGPTDRVLVLLEDGGTDRDYDDYVGILEVTSTPPAYPVSPNSLAFGNVPRNTTSIPMTVTVTNAGATQLAIGSIKLGGASPGQFARISQCPSSLAPGNSCAVTVSFKPKYKNTAYATLSLTVGGSKRVVGLYGTGF